MSSITKSSNYISLEDRKELLNALNNKDITKQQFDEAYKVAEKIMDELLNNKNKFVNRGLNDYLKFVPKK